MEELKLNVENYMKQMKIYDEQHDEVGPKVYILENPKNGKKYIGHTNQKLRRRLYAGRPYTSPEMSKKNLKSWKKSVIDNLTDDEARQLETALILHFESNNPEKGYNRSISDGTTGLHFAHAYAPTFKKRNLKIKCENLKTNEITYYNSISEAARANGFKTAQKISDVINGHRYTAYKCKWSTVAI